MPVLMPTLFKTNFPIANKNIQNQTTNITPASKHCFIY